jgi:arabinofuranosyltransferase
LAAIPVVAILLAGWAHRWTTDDGFINVRVVQQIFAGNGPVFNAGERVEATTSPAWLALLVAGRAVFFWLPIEWSAVIFGLATTAVACVVAQVAAGRLHQTARLIPFGILVYVVLPPAWDFTTSGLENGLTLLWIATTQLAFVNAGRSRRWRDLLIAAFLAGLGPLVRPDLIVMSLVWGAAILLLARPWSGRGVAQLAVAALAVPGAYEAFRIIYYGALVPNTAFTKEASRARWDRGWLYLKDFVSPYWLWVPLALAGVAFAVVVLSKSARSFDDVLLYVAAPLAGLTHVFFVVRAGGDHMHARLLLPALFAILLPVAAIPRRAATALLLPVLAGWAVLPLWSGGPPYHGVGPDQIANERTVWISRSSAHYVTVDDYRGVLDLVAFGDAAREAAAAGERVLFYVGLSGLATIGPLKASVAQDAVLTVGAVGVASVAAGTYVFVADYLGLGDPLGSRIKVVERGRPGHEKVMPISWMVARLVAPGAVVPPRIATSNAVDAAHRALRCPQIRELLARADAPLTTARIGQNIFSAVAEHRTRISADPAVVAASCDD